MSFAAIRSYMPYTVYHIPQYRQVPVIPKQTAWAEYMARRTTTAYGSFPHQRQIKEQERVIIALSEELFQRRRPIAHNICQQHLNTLFSYAHTQYQQCEEDPSLIHARLQPLSVVNPEEVLKTQDIHFMTTAKTHRIGLTAMYNYRFSEYCTHLQQQAQQHYIKELATMHAAYQDKWNRDNAANAFYAAQFAHSHKSSTEDLTYAHF